MKYIFLIRHAKSSWSDPALDDFDRPLNKRGKRDGPDMAIRLTEKKIYPDLILSSSAKRAKKTAQYFAKESSYKKENIIFYDQLYLGSLHSYLAVLGENIEKANTLFLVGHNFTITDLAEHLTQHYFDNLPTAAVVGVEFQSSASFLTDPRTGRLFLYDFPKNRNDNQLG